jgi:hypothetical protein
MRCILLSMAVSESRCVEHHAMTEPNCQLYEMCSLEQFHETNSTTILCEQLLSKAIKFLPWMFSPV